MADIATKFGLGGGGGGGGPNYTKVSEMLLVELPSSLEAPFICSSSLLSTMGASANPGVGSGVYATVVDLTGAGIVYMASCESPIGAAVTTALKFTLDGVVTDYDFVMPTSGGYSWCSPQNLQDPTLRDNSKAATYSSVTGGDYDLKIASINSGAIALDAPPLIGVRFETGFKFEWSVITYGGYPSKILYKMDP